MIQRGRPAANVTGMSSEEQQYFLSNLCSDFLAMGDCLVKHWPGNSGRGYANGRRCRQASSAPDHYNIQVGRVSCMKFLCLYVANQYGKLVAR